MSSSDAFWAAIRSVGTAASLAASGVYLHRRKMVTADTKHALTRFGQQIALPSLFFGKIVRCSGNEGHCSSVLDHCGDAAWILLVWPVYICGCGLVVGWIGYYLSATPKSQRGSVVVATAFANSAGLPITLLTVIDENLRQQGIASTIDPNQFLSIYTLVYPVLQWSIGGWILSNEKDQHDEQKSSSIELPTAKLKWHTRTSDVRVEEDEEEISLVPQSPRSLIDLQLRGNGTENERIRQERTTEPSNIEKFLSKAVQPPVVGALSGLLVTAIAPVRGLFVDVSGQGNPAVLGWLLDAIICAGSASVPISMAILGVNLSLAARSDDHHFVSASTVTAVVLGKMVVLPLIGVASTLLLQQVWEVPEEIYTSFYLVAAIEFVPPTATNVMVMVDLMGSIGMKEAMARMIGFQYLAAPVLLSLWVMLVVRIATNNQRDGEGFL